MTAGEAPTFRWAERKRLVQAREGVPPAIHADWSEAISALLVPLLDRLAPRILGFYWAHRGEYDPGPVIERRIAAGSQAALPVVVARGAPLQFRPWTPDTAMVEDPRSFGIPHPVEGPAVLPDALLVPLLGFDEAGYRLGHGGGYFDRTLAALRPRPLAIGVGFELGRIATIHPEAHDIPMDMIVTERGIFRPGGD